MSEYISPKDAADKWGIKVRRVTTLCNNGRISGAYKVGNGWIIPSDAEKPTDARIKSGEYIGFKEERQKKKIEKDGERE